MTRPTIKGLTEQVAQLTTENEQLFEQISALMAQLDTQGSELEAAKESVKKANLISAKKFDEARPEPVKFRGGAMLPTMSEMVKSINQLF